LELNDKAKARYAQILRERLKARSPEQAERIDSLSDEQLIEMDALHTQRRVEAIRQRSQAAAAGAESKRNPGIPIVRVL